MVKENIENFLHRKVEKKAKGDLELKLNYFHVWINY